MSRDGASPDTLFTGGALPPNSPSYVERPADNDLFESALAGKLCCIFAPHHMGKSSLMFRTAKRLEQRGFRTITADLATLSSDSSIVQSFQYLTMCLKHQLKLSVDPATWWWEVQAYSDPTHAIVDFLRDEVLGKIEEPVVIFLDGIDTTLNSDILDSMLTAIRSMYQARETDPVWRRLTFVLLGSASLDDLVRNHSHFPFKECHYIDLCDFTSEEAQVLQRVLLATCPDAAETVFSRILFWTNGHPYLTQKLCIAVANAQDADGTDEWVDGLVKRVFLSPEVGIEPNLQLTKDGIRTSRRRRQLLSCYRRVYKGRKVQEDQRSFAQSRLGLIGLVRGESGTLKVRNEVYRSVFDSAWIKANMPVSWTPRIAVVAILLIILLAGFANVSFSQKQWITEAQAFIDSFRNASNPDERLVGEEPTPADQVVLVEPTAALTNTPTPTYISSPTAASPTSTPTRTSVPSTPTPVATNTAEPTTTREMDRAGLTPEVAHTAPTTAKPTTTPTVGLTPTLTPRPTTVPTATHTPILTPTPPTSIATPTSTVPPTPTSPLGRFALLEPTSLDDPTHGPTDFVWIWSGSVPPGFGFEVRVWRKGEPQLGAHDAILDNQSGNIENIDGHKYHLNTNIEEAAGVGGRSGIYSWTVALVQVSPSYADIGQQARPAQLRLELLGASDDDEDSGGGGIGIE